MSVTETATDLTEKRFDVATLREQFPALQQEAHGKRLAYLDNAATTQKPARVIDAVADYYRHDNANVHRAVHVLSQRATEAYEGAREKIRALIDAETVEQIVFTRGTTEAINLAAYSYARPRLGPGDEVVVTTIEHHSNIVPWQLACEATGAELRVAPVTDAAELDFDAFERSLTERTKIVAIGHISNAFGTVHPVREAIAAAHERDIPVLLDGAQAIAHLPVDVRDLDVDFYAFSGHKMFGPTGIGVLYAKAELLDAMIPYQGGGDMIETVSFEGSTWAEPPAKFEAGTPNIAGAVGLGEAADFLSGLDLSAVAAHEDRLRRRAEDAMSEIPGLRIVGTAPDKAAIISFTLEGAHPHDLATILDTSGVAVRTGHHCAMPGMERFGVPATARASFACYNNDDDVDALIEGLQSCARLFG